MGQLLRKPLFTYLYFCLALLMGVATQNAFGQSAGDAAFTGFNSDGPGDGFSVVLFTSYSAGEKVHFSSYEWNGNDFEDSGGGDLTWVAPSGGTNAGTVLVFSDVEDAPSVNVGSITDDANMNLSGSGDVVYAYTSTDKATGPFTFLGAIATAAEIYSNDTANPEPDGTLEGTGLTQGSTAILLPENIDNAEYIGDRSGNTPSGYRTLLNDVGTEDATDDNWDIYNGDDLAPFPPFSDESFTVVSPPTIAFASANESGEEGNSVNLTVELREANSSVDVDVDVVFLGSSSSASESDIDEFSSQTVSFTGASTGASQNVPITLTANDGFEGTEKAVFQLQNSTTGSIINPSDVTVTITDGDTPEIVINEIYFDPTTNDANNDNNSVGSSDEFVELVNKSGQDIDISGWELWDGVGEKYTFPNGAVIPANRAFVVFADPAVGTNYGGALLYSAGTLGLNNSGDDVILKDENGINIDEVIDFSGSATDESITRNSDITGNFEGHTSADTDDNSPYSPGTKINGDPFGSDHAIAIRGSEGWRMISSPVQSATFDDFFGDFWMQGVDGSDDPGGPETLLSWAESSGGSFSAPANMSDPMTAGKGYIVYAFEDDEFNTPGIQGGFPKVVNTNNVENSSPVSVGVTASDNDGSSSIDGDEGWNLLGNPYGTDISVDALFIALETASMTVNTNIYVWDHDASGGPAYVELTKGDGERLAPFQAFWVRYTQAGSDNISLNRGDLEANIGTEFYKGTSDTPISFMMELHGEDDYFDTYTLEFNEKGSTELDRYDGYHLFSLDPNSINLYSTLNNNRLQKNVLPRDLDSNLEIPLSFQANGRSSLTFRWEKIKEIPNDWDVMLLDKETDEEIDLRTSNEYQFNVIKQQEQKEVTQEKSLLNKATSSEDDSDSRFVLSVKPNADQSNSGEIPNTASLNPNYPNPFNPTTTISYELSQDTEVTLTVWNMIGQKVATLVDGQVEAGEHQETWNAANMPSGIYIARFQVGSEVFTRKMTLIK